MLAYLVLLRLRILAQQDPAEPAELALSLSKFGARVEIYTGHNHNVRWVATPLLGLGRYCFGVKGIAFLLCIIFLLILLRPSLVEMHIPPPGPFILGSKPFWASPFSIPPNNLAGGYSQKTANHPLSSFCSYSCSYFYVATLFGISMAMAMAMALQLQNISFGYRGQALLSTLVDRLFPLCCLSN